MIVLLLIEWVVQPLATVTMIYGALNIVKGEKKSVKENFLYGFLKVPAVVWVNFLVGIYIFFISLGGLLLLQIFGGSIIGLALLLAMLIAVVYMTTIWYFTDHVVTIQQMSGFDALEMSKRVVQNYFKQTLGYIALFVVLTGMVNFVLEKGLDILYYAASYYIYIIGSIVFNFIKETKIERSTVKTILLIHREIVAHCYFDMDYSDYSYSQTLSMILFYHYPSTQSKKYLQILLFYLSPFYFRSTTQQQSDFLYERIA